MFQLSREYPKWTHYRISCADEWANQEAKNHLEISYRKTLKISNSISKCHHKNDQKNLEDATLHVWLIL